MQIEAGGHFTRAAATFGGRIAVQSGQRTASYSELRQSANRIGSSLLDRGLVQGDRVAVLSYNCPEIVEIWLGLERTGLVRVVLHSHFDMAIHVQTLNQVGAVALIFDTRFRGQVEAHKAEMQTVKHFIAVGEAPPAWAVSYDSLLQRGTPEDIRLDIDENAPFCIQLTTGTTGFPKPWVVSHRAWRTLITNNLEHLDTLHEHVVALCRQDVNLHFHALQWASGSQTMMPYMLRGARNIILDDQNFDPVLILRVITTEGVTGAFIPAPMLVPLLDVIEAQGGIEHRLRRLVIFFATPELLERTTRILGPIWCHGFGSTEQGAPATRLTCHEAAEKPARLRSVGRPVSPFFEVAVVDEFGKRQPPGGLGEIVVRSAISNSKYWNLPKVTEAAFFPGDWFRPGDVGYQDEEGFLYYLDRATDRIHSGDGVVYPHVVESALLGHAAIANCGVVGLGEVHRQDVVAAILLKPGISGTPALEEEIMMIAKAGLPKREIPKRVIFVDDLPTVLGGAKIQRQVLQRRLAARQEKQ